MKQFTSNFGLVAATLLLSAAQPVVAHSWVEQLMVIASNGTMTGAPGYIRGFISRATAGFNDDMDNFLIPPNGRPTGDKILDTDHLCHPSQRTSNYSTEFPMLSASSGDFIALRYQENGHVTLPDVNPTKPLNRGTVYIYGTTEPAKDELFLDVFQKWTADGTGGNGRGRLLATRNFDDGQCYQINGGPISTGRQSSFKKVAESPQGADLWCQNDIQLPSDLTKDSKYTLYWVWSWPTFSKAGAATDIATADNNATLLQYYTSCMDVNIVDGSSSSSGKKKQVKTNNFAASFVSKQDLNSAAVLSQLEVGAFQVSVPGSTGSSSDSGNDSGSSAGTSTSTKAGTASTKTSAAAGTASSANGDHTVYVTVTAAQSTATVTVTEAAATASAQTTPARKTRTITTEDTVFVTRTVDPSSSGTSTAVTQAAAAATTASSATGNTAFIATPGQTFTVQPFLSSSATAATTFKRVRRN